MPEKIDLSYKRNARKAYYDIEVLHDIFTNFVISEGIVDVTIIADHYYDDISNGDIRAALDSYLKDEDVQRICNGEPELIIRRFAPDDDMSELCLFLSKFIVCQNSWDKPSRFTEYYGWNSSRYDLTVLCTTMGILSKKNNRISPSDLKFISDQIISYDGPPWGLIKHLAQTGLISENELKNKLNIASWSDGHIDIAKITKSDDGGGEAKYPPGLKKEMARFGLDIVIDEAVSDDHSRRLTKEEFLDLIIYNGNDVLGTALIGYNDIVKYGIFTRDIVREMYPYTSAKSLPQSKLGKWSAPERDATAANIAGLVLIGPNRSKPNDHASVKLDFPLADGKIVDLLDYMRDHESFMHPDLYTFFDHFRGKNTSSSYEDWKVKQNQPITHSAQMNCPYYREGKPIDAYIRVSTGGAHGSVMAGLSKMTDSEITSWIREDVGAIDVEKPTIDMKDVIHVDWSSFYPVLASKLKMYQTSDGVDRYTGIIDYRIKIKTSLPHLKEEWTDEHHRMQEEQMGLKFILNNATGAGNMHQKYALLPVDNKTLGMRLIGNLHIWCLAQRFVEAGAYVIATNTDGIYVCNISLEDSQKVIDDYVSVYGMDVEPEHVDRFINRDTSTRIEYQGTTRTAVNGRLRHGIEMRYTDAAIGRNVPYPLVAARAALDYMDDESWLNDKYDRSRLEEIVQKLYDESDDPEAWYHIYVGSGKRRMTKDGDPLGRINRVVLTKEGSELGLISVRDFTKGELSQIIMADDPLEMIQEMGYEFEAPYQEGDEIISYSKLEDELISNNSYRIARAKKDPSLMRGKLGLLRDEKVIPFRPWKPGNLTGYTSTTGMILNTRESLRNFDMSQLDLNAYVDWAESLLDGWKVTADIPEIGLSQQDDTVIPRKTKKRVTKAQVAKDKIRDLYFSTLL